MSNPKLRFKREDGTEYPEWEEKALDAICSFSKGIGLSWNDISSDGSYPCILYGNLYTHYGAVINEVYYRTNTVVAKKSKKGDILIPASDTTPTGLARASCIMVADVLLGGDINILSPNSKIYSPCLSYCINANKHLLIQNIQGITVRHLKCDNIKTITINYPTDIEEQQKIADFLSVVDEVIAQSEAEVQNLEQQKKGVMQKIFSQEVRFKREDGTDYPEWEADIISNICSIKTGESNSQDQNENGKYPFYIRSEKPVKSNRFLYDCEAVLTIGDGNIGKVFHYVNGKFDIHQRVYMMNDFQDVIAKYFYYYFSMFFYKRAMRLNAKGTVNSVRREMIADMTISVPCLEEQQKIADFLSAYDEAISYAKQELDKWKELKKGLLQQMFV